MVTSPPLLRIPLHKGKSLRNTLKEQGLLEDFLRRHQYEFSEKNSNIGVVAIEPLINYLDVSVCRPSQGWILMFLVSCLATASLPSGTAEPVGHGGHLPAISSSIMGQ